MNEYVFSFSNEMESNGNKHNLLDEIVYGIYSSEKEAILDAMRMYEDCGYEFTHLFVGQPEYFVPRIDAVEAAMDRIEDCGLDDYERGKTKECLRKGMRLL